jgi:hypothetical protein
VPTMTKGHGHCPACANERLSAHIRQAERGWSVSQLQYKGEMAVFPESRFGDFNDQLNRK